MINSVNYIFEINFNKSLFRIKPKNLTKNFFSSIFGNDDPKGYIVKLYDELFPLGFLYGLQEGWAQILKDYQYLTQQVIDMVQDICILVAKKNPLYSMTVTPDLYHQILKHGFEIPHEGLRNKAGNLFKDYNTCEDLVSSMINVGYHLAFDILRQIQEPCIKKGIEFASSQYTKIFVDEAIKKLKKEFGR